MLKVFKLNRFSIIILNTTFKCFIKAAFVFIKMFRITVLVFVFRHYVDVDHFRKYVDSQHIICFVTEVVNTSFISF